MEQRNYGRRKSRIPAFIRSGYLRHLTQEASDRSRSLHGLDSKDFNRESSASKKIVTMAPTSRYMTSRSLYTARKPLISTEHQISILKNPLTHEYSERLHMSNVANCQTQDGRTDSNMLDSTSVPQIIASSLSATREDLCASLNLSELRLCSSHEEPNFSPVPSASKVESRSHSISPLDDLSLTVPLSPNWTSTQRIFPHSYTSQTHTSQRTRAFKQERDSQINTGFSLSDNKSYSSEPKQLSHYQTTYWACAIPSTLPPSPDRKSPSWDPDKEYENLLDYTYPLRPNMTNTWSSSEHRSGTDQPLQDSGIEVDSFLSSSSLSFLEQPVSGMRQSRSGPVSTQTFGFQNPNLRKLAHSKSSDIGVSRSLNSSLEQVGLSLESMDCDGKDSFHYKKFGIFSTSRSAPTFIRSTSILPRLGSLGEWDEEFLQLPEQLLEIQDLSQKLNDITAQISQPVTTNWESLQRESASVRSSSVQMEKQAAEVSCVQGSAEEFPLTEQMKRVDSRMQITRDVGDLRDLNQNLRDVEAIVDELSGMSLYEFKRKTESDEVAEETQESLLRYLQTFCSNLEKLIHWLHKVVEKIDVLSPPSVDIESVKASLADYKSFQEEVQDHRPLTASVLQTGEMLLCCMNSASPFLKDTLTLIERQSYALETHSEYLFSSILSTMDCLTEPNSQDDTEETSFSSQDQ
ncbi:centrosomal protein of 68 kDa [Ictalurus furcatus]|uniref:centrosomal protein of 68 kDa n=1 Tax=Ictalurus furcatus TaxID=66913 RepID=UPI00235071DE|nr:centrosomal protein of 68 kDa [Ictalurus furcatus]XP_053477564.1 centrosomal protein of 68 kDa [Ictalurus furcatus]